MKAGDTVRVLTGMFEGHEDIIEAIVPPHAEQPEHRYDVRNTGHRWYFADELVQVITSTIEEKAP